MGFKGQIGLQFGGELKNREGRRGEEEEEEKKRKKEDSSQDQAKVWKLTLNMDSMRLSMNFYAWLVSSLSPNLGFC